MDDYVEDMRLWACAQQGLVHEIERAQRDTPCPPNGRWPDDVLRKALYVAAWNDEGAVLRALLREPNARGLVVRCNDGQRSSLLQSAARRGSTAAAQVLIDAKADVNYCDSLYLYHEPVVEAVLSGHAATVQLLAAAGADLFIQPRVWAAIPLCLAASNGHVDVLQVLLSAKVHADARSGSATALCYGVVYGHLAAAQVLVLAGANVNICNELGWTPLFAAANLGRTDLVHLLLEAKADVDGADRAGWTRTLTPIAAAAGHGQLSAVKLLASAKADLERADKRGETPLFHATERNDADMVKCLLCAGADARRPNNLGETPLSIAQERGHDAVVRLLQ